MDQFVIKTGSKEKSNHYLSPFLFGKFYYTEIASIYRSRKEADAAVVWGKKDIAKQMKDLKQEIAGYDKELRKGNITINKVSRDKAVKELKDLQGYKFDVVKL